MRMVANKIADKVVCPTFVDRFLGPSATVVIGGVVGFPGLEGVGWIDAGVALTCHA